MAATATPGTFEVVREWAGLNNDLGHDKGYEGV